MNFKTALILFSLFTLVSCGKDLRRAIGADHQAEIDRMNDQINDHENDLNDAVADIAVLNGHENIVDLVDPCGDGPGYDEVLLKTSSGKLIAYFEVGNKRFLSVLSNGTYQTTDQQACIYRVLDGEVL